MNYICNCICLKCPKCPKGPKWLELPKCTESGDEQGPRQGQLLIPGLTCEEGNEVRDETSLPIDNDGIIEKDMVEIDDFDAGPSEIRVGLLVCYYIF